MDFFQDLDLFGAGEILLLKPSWNSSPVDTLEGDAEVVSSGGVDEVASQRDAQNWQGEFRANVTNVTEQGDRLRHFQGRMGRLRSFWAPSYVSDFQVMADSAEGTREVYVVPNNFEWAFEPNRYGIYIETLSHRVICQIEGYDSVEGREFDILRLKSQLPAAIKAHDVQLISLVRRVRYDTDRLPMTFYSDAVGEVSYSLLERPDEVQFLKQIPLSSLELGWAHEPFSGHVLVGSGWWDADSSPEDGSGGTERAIRTNQTGAVLEVVTEVGTTTWGFVPENLPYSSLDAAGNPVHVRPPYYAFRRREVDILGQYLSEWSSWDYIKTAPQDDYEQGYVVVSDIDPSRRWLIQVVNVGWLSVGVSPEVPPNFTRMYEPGQKGMVDPALNNAVEPSFGYFWQIKGVVLNAEGNLRTFSDIRIRLNYLVLTDSNGDGIVEPDTTDPDYAPRDDDLGMEQFDHRGTVAQWSWRLKDAYEKEFPNVRICINNATLGGRIYHRITPAARAAAGWFADIADLADRVELHTNSRPFHAKFLPDIITFGYTVNDQAYVQLVDAYSSSTSRDECEEIVARTRALWPNVRWVLVPYPRQDAGNNVATGLPVNVRQSIIDVKEVNHPSDSWISWVDLSTVIDDAYDRAPHMTAREHKLALASVYPSFKAHLSERLLLAVSARRSQIAAVL